MFFATAQSALDCFMLCRLSGLLASVVKHQDVKCQLIDRVQLG